MIHRQELVRQFEQTKKELARVCEELRDTQHREREAARRAQISSNARDRAERESHALRHALGKVQAAVNEARVVAQVDGDHMAPVIHISEITEALTPTAQNTPLLRTA